MPDNMSSSLSDSDSFEEKLAREMEDEYSAEWGIFEEGKIQLDSVACGCSHGVQPLTWPAASLRTCIFNSETDTIFIALT